MWRWSYLCLAELLYLWVFSTCVEVILKTDELLNYMPGILHVCGGDPDIDDIQQVVLVYSPRVWRWSLDLLAWYQTKLVFSTCVEVILAMVAAVGLMLCILHVCGGDPVYGGKVASAKAYSPRVWRWSSTNKTAESLSQVFSTCVEVIPFSTRLQDNSSGILHVCGGDPRPQPSCERFSLYSPRVWRWSLVRIRAK